jgi:tetratricopeptide (TPR) repeat protein
LRRERRDGHDAPEARRHLGGGGTTALGLFDFWSKKPDKREAHAPRTPLEIAREVERLIEGGDLRAALDISEKGVYDHPRSEVVNAAYRFLRKTTLGEDVVTLRREVETAPGPARYTRLAEAYKEIGDYDKALETCHRAIALYPDHEGAWLILAQIRMERFREDWIPRDCELAIDFYERSYDLNRNSKRTLIELAELYAELGMKQRAIRKCEGILYFAPEDEKALATLKKAQALPDAKREDLAERVAAYADKKRRAAQRRSRLPGDALGPSGRLIKQPELLKQKLDDVEQALPTATAALGLSLDGAIVAASTKDLDALKLREPLHDLFEAGNRCSLLMDIGHFKRGVFEGPSGYVYLVEFDQLRIAVLCSAKTRFDRLDEAMTRLVEDEIYR